MADPDNQNRNSDTNQENSSQNRKEGAITVSLSRELSLFDITMIGIAGMIGAGIFALTGIATGIAGPAILIAFLLNGITATFTGLAYAELGSSIPEAGGSYLWVKEAMGDHFGFLAGWCDWAAHTIACALYAVTFGAFFSELIVRFFNIHVSQPVLAKVSALVIVSLLTYINYRGAKESSTVGSSVTLFKVTILVVFAAFGIFKTLTSPGWIKAFTPLMPHGIPGVLAAMGLTYIAFEGYEIIVQSGEEVRNPEKNIPKAIVLSLWVAVAIYVLVAFALIGAVKADIPSWMYLGKLAEFSLIRVGDQIMPFGAVLIIAGGLVSTISAMNATIYSSSRVAFALGRTGYLPRSLSKIDEKTRTPHFSIFFSYLIISIMALAPIEAVASAADVMFLILFVMVNLVLVILRLRRPDLRRAFRLPLVPCLPAIAIITQIVIGYYLLTELEHGGFVVAVTIAWIIFGSLVYYAYSEKEKAQRIEEVLKTVYEEVPVEKPAFNVLVPVANPVFGRRLAKFASVIAEERRGGVIVLSIVKLPPQTPPSSATRYIEEAKRFIGKITRSVSVPAGGLIKVGHSVPDAILNAAEEVKPDLIVLGWRGRTFRKDCILGSTIDPVLVKARCDVVVVRFGPERKIERILIPTAGGPHAVLAAEIARDVAVHEGASVELLYVGRDESDEKRAKIAFEETLKPLEGLNISTRFILSQKPVREIAKEVEKHDLTLIGATNESFLKNFLMGVFPERIVQKTTRTVAMTRKWVRIVEAIQKKRKLE